MCMEASKAVVLQAFFLATRVPAHSHHPPGKPTAPERQPDVVQKALTYVYCRPKNLQRVYRKRLSFEHLAKRTYRDVRAETLNYC